MNGPFDISTEYQWEEADGPRGCDGSVAFRLTRERDGASVLLHEIDPHRWPNIREGVFSSQLPDFNEPFITHFSDIVELPGRTFLAEPLPPCVSLLDTWRAVLQSNPDQAANMLRQLIDQLERLRRRLDGRHDRHGAVCAANVVLTTQGTYGLLAARLETAQGEVCLRPLTHATPALDLSSFTERPETIAWVLLDLLAIEAELAVLSVGRRAELNRLCDPYIPAMK